MTEFVEIYPIKIIDVIALQNISKQTFIETFKDQNTDANMQQYLQTNLSINQLSIELQNQNSFFYFAAINQQIIGYLKINLNDAQTELKLPNTLEIERIYILKAFQGKGIGEQLLKKAIEIATSKKLDYVWLGVWEKNVNAINFYLKNGFIEFNKHVFQLGSDEQIDILMKFDLLPHFA